MQTLFWPLSYAMQAALELIYSLTSNYGLAVILLSCLVSSILLPLHLLAEKIQQRGLQEKEKMLWELVPAQQIQNSRERYYYTSYIYKKYRYHPIKSLQSLLGLCIQLPFFLAAYFMLDNFSGFAEQGFLFISDLSSPDHLLKGFNLLPILMALVSLLSAGLHLVSHRDSGKSDIAVQLGIPFLFLVLLYQSSAALLLYWTCNNLYSLIKNGIVARRKGLPPRLPILQWKYFWAYLRWKRVEGLIWGIVKKINKPAVIKVNLGLLLYSLLVVYLYNPSEAPSTIHLAGRVSILLLDLLLFLIIYNNKLYLFNLFHLNTKKNNFIKFAINILLTIIISYLLINILIYHINRVPILNLPTFINSYKWLMIFQIILLIVLYIYTQYMRIIKIKNKINNNKLKQREIFLLSLLPSNIILNLVYSNLDYFTVKNSIIFIFIVIVAVYIILSLVNNIFYWNFLSKDSVIISTCIFTTYFITPTILPIFKLNNNHSLFLQLFILISLLIIILLLYNNYKNYIFSIVICLFLFNTFIYTKYILLEPESFAKTIKHNEKDQNKSDSHFYAGKKPEIDTKNKKFAQNVLNKIEKTPHIYLLIYDGYPNIHMMDYYGIDNKGQFDFLAKNNFTFYDKVYSLWHNSVRSISNILEFVHYPGLKQTTESLRRKFVAGDNLTNYILRAKDYNTYNLLSSNYMFLGNEPSTSLTSPRPSLSNTDVLLGLLYGEFKFDRNHGGTNLLGLLGKNNYLSSEELQNIKSDIFSANSSKPKFVYTHIGPGHSQNSGKCLPNETDLFEHRLRKANYFMQQDVNAITSSNKNAIIIIAGDHGPYLTKNCRYLEGIPENEVTARDVVDRLGMFMAIKWPQDYRKTTKIETLQDIMPEIFSYMTNGEILSSYQKPVQKESYLSNRLMIKNGIIQYGRDKGKSLYYWLDK